MDIVIIDFHEDILPGRKQFFLKILLELCNLSSRTVSSDWTIAYIHVLICIKRGIRTNIGIYMFVNVLGI